MTKHLLALTLFSLILAACAGPPPPPPAAPVQEPAENQSAEPIESSDNNEDHTHDDDADHTHDEEDSDHTHADTHAGQADITGLVLSSTNPDCEAYVGTYSSMITDVSTNREFDGSLTISSDGSTCTFQSNQIPNHDAGEGSNFATPIDEVSATLSIPADPQLAATKSDINFGANAILLNGIKWEAYPAACFDVGRDPLGREAIGCGPDQLDHPWRYDIGSPLNDFGWIKNLYRIRWGFVRLLGMKQEGIPQSSHMRMQPSDVPMRAGEDATFFTVEMAEDGRFWIASTTESHLTAYLGVVVEPLAQGNRFHVLTIVHYHNWTGPVYFNVIRPFHHIVVGKMAQAGVANKNDLKIIGGLS